MEQKNINWINLIKALCIIFVYFRHVEVNYGFFIGDKLDGIISTFYVNAFFFVSGYLLFWKQLSAPKILEDRKTYILTGGGKLLFLNILYRIVIPSIIFSAIEFLPSCIIQGRALSIGFLLYKTIGGRTYWFTSALVVSELVLLILFCTRKKNIWFYAICSFILSGITLWVVKNNLLENGLWAWQNGLIALVFLAMGGLYWRYETLMDRCFKWWVLLLLLTMYFVLTIGLWDISNPGLNTLTIQPLGFLTSAIVCLLLVWLLKKCHKLKIISFIGQNSLGFYFLSGALPISLSKAAHLFFTGTHLYLFLIIWIICVFVAYLTVMIINRWLPWLWDFRNLKMMNRGY